MKIASVQLCNGCVKIETVFSYGQTIHWMTLWISIMLWVTYIHFDHTEVVGCRMRRVFSEIADWDLEQGPALHRCTWIFLAHSEAESTLLVTHHPKSHSVSSVHTNYSHPKLDLDSESALMSRYAPYLMTHTWQWLKATESKMTVVCAHRILQRWLL